MPRQYSYIKMLRIMQRNPKYSFFQIVIPKSRFSKENPSKIVIFESKLPILVYSWAVPKIFQGTRKFFEDVPESFESFDDGFEVYFGFGLFERILYYPIINQVWLISILIRHLKFEF